jgi:threonine/homoserine/homoserine lactone efflux protein
MSPGPNGLLIAKTVATTGKKAGFANVGAAYLSWIGIKSLIAAFRPVETPVAKSSRSSNKSLKKSFIGGFLTNALNPKVSMF